MSIDKNVPPMSEKEKKQHVALLNDCFAIIKRLYDADKFWGPLYIWIKKRTMHGDTLDVILACLKEIEKEAGHDHKPIGFWPYMEGIRRRIMRDMDAKKLRGGDMSLSDMLGPVIEKFGGKKHG